jgi:hypothetical protein
MVRLLDQISGMGQTAGLLKKLLADSGPPPREMPPQARKMLGQEK